MNVIPIVGINPMVTVESTAFMLSKRLVKKLRPEGLAAVEARYNTPTPEEKQGKVHYPSDETLKGDYGIRYDW